MSGLISGVVRGADGTPIAQARVFFTSAPTAVPDIAALTNQRGEFTLAASASGDYGIEVGADGFVPGAAVVSVAEQGKIDIEIRLAPSAG